MKTMMMAWHRKTLNSPRTQSQSPASAPKARDVKHATDFRRFSRSDHWGAATFFFFIIIRDDSWWPWGHGRASLRPYKFPDFRISKDMFAGGDDGILLYDDQNTRSSNEITRTKQRWSQTNRSRKIEMKDRAIVKMFFFRRRDGGSSGLKGGYGLTDHVPSHRPPWPCPYPRSLLVTRTWRSLVPLQEKFKLLWSILLIRHVVSQNRQS